MNIYMAVIRKMEDAISECENGSSRPKTLSWDEAVALYTGSKEGKDGRPQANFFMSLRTRDASTLTPVVQMLTRPRVMQR